MPHGVILNTPQRRTKQSRDDDASSAPWWSIRSFLSSSEYEQQKKTATQLALEELQNSSEFQRFQSDPSQKFRADSSDSSDSDADEEFVAAYFSQASGQSSETGHNMDHLLFAYIDLDRDGLISASDLLASAHLLSVELSSVDIDAMLLIASSTDDHASGDHRNRVSLAQFSSASVVHHNLWSKLRDGAMVDLLRNAHPASFSKRVAVSYSFAK